MPVMSSSTLILCLPLINFLCCFHRVPRLLDPPAWEPRILSGFAWEPQILGGSARMAIATGVTLLFLAIPP